MLHLEAVVVPRDGLEVGDLESAAQELAALHWTTQDVVVVPVARLPEELDQKV